MQKINSTTILKLLLLFIFLGATSTTFADSMRTDAVDQKIILDDINAYRHTQGLPMLQNNSLISEEAKKITVSRWLQKEFHLVTMGLMIAPKDCFASSSLHMLQQKMSHILTIPTRELSLVDG